MHRASAHKALLPKSKRLLKAVEFQQVFSHQKKHHSNQYIRVITASNTEGFCRLGLAISKKVARRAVDRNRIKRHIRESFRREFAEPTGKDSLDLIVMAKNGAAQACNDELRTAINELLTTISTMHRHQAQCIAIN